jgi:F0F1-type ATP synthase assembly protein I
MAGASSWQDDLAATVRTLRIILTAISMGCVIFLMIVVAAGGNRAPSSEPILTCIAAGFAALAVAVRFIVPGVVVSQGRKKMLQETAAGDAMDNWPNRLMRLMMTKTFVAAAILEGAIFFLLIAYLVEKSPWSLAVAIALLVGIAFLWPMQSSALVWIDGQLRRLQDERQFSS